ncbi:hypothetical protein MFIFM68171_07076 [Madurella fahalii]|uniref:2EXR domain-containing protein n=1 Tax=Madurella fahalii TaxID=1157608 RepID=A0ABQ0GGG9_9PEZI
MAQEQFHQFPRLSIELRYMVWEASFDPRLVEANIIHNGTRRARTSPIEWRLTRNPTVMEVSYESRAVALRHYKKLLLGCAVEVWGPPPPAPYIYFHPEMDILCQDFECIVSNYTEDRVRRPGTKTRVILPNGFEDILRNPNTFNLGMIRHIQVNLHIFRSSNRNRADRRLQTMLSFLWNLLRGQRAPAQQQPNSLQLIGGQAFPPLLNGLQTITISITQERSQDHGPQAPGAVGRVRPWVYRVVAAQPSLPEPTLTYLSALGRITAGMHPPLACTLLSDGAILTKPCDTRFAIFRVIDPRSMISAFDDMGQMVIREFLWRRMLDAGVRTGQIERFNWLAMLISVDPLRPYRPIQLVSPWGICGTNYAMGRATAYTDLRMTDKFRRRWN